VCEDGNKDEYLLEEVENIMTEEIKLPGNVLLDKTCQ